MGVRIEQRRSGGIWILGLLTVWGICVVLPLFVNASRLCFPAWDLGIYAQALARIGAGQWNPWLSVRQVFVFNDHFDPILLLLGWPTRWIEPATWALLLEVAFLTATGLLLAALALRVSQRFEIALLFGAAFFLSPATLTVIQFPVHPGAWAVFPLVIYLWSLGAESQTQSGWRFAALVFLLLFKEEYVFVGIATSLLLLVRKPQRASGFVLLGISLLWAAFVFGLRPRLMGETVGYTEGFMAPWFQDSRAMLEKRILDWGIWRGWLESHVPLLALLFWLRRQNLRFTPESLVTYIVLFSIRLISGRWGHHYLLVLPTVLLAGSLGARSTSFSRTKDASPGTSGERSLKPVIATTALLLVLIQLPYLGRIWGKTLFRGGLAHCPGSETRLSEMAKVTEILKTRSLSETLLASGNWVPRFTDEATLLHLESVSTPPQGPFWVVYELPPTGDAWPLGARGRQELLLRFERTHEAIREFVGSHVQVIRYRPRAAGGAPPSPSQKGQS